MPSHHHAVILTYHRVLKEMEMNFQFYDLPFDRFKMQMQTVINQGQGDCGGPEICITFDDGTEDHFAAGNFLSYLGLSGTFFIIVGRLGQKGYLTPDQVSNLARQGHRIGSHTMTHPHLTKLSLAQLDDELITSRRVLQEITGQTVDWLAPPGGIYNKNVLDRALELGYSVFRTMEWGYVKNTLIGRIPCIPILHSCNAESFHRILEGNASLWPYTIKEGLRKVVGDKYYNKIRNNLSAISRKPKWEIKM